MNSLPFETLGNIAEHLIKDQPTLVSLCLLNLTWYNAAIRYLYYTPKIKTTRALVAITQRHTLRHIGFIRHLKIFDSHSTTFTDNDLHLLTAQLECYKASSFMNNIPLKITSLSLSSKNFTYCGVTPLLNSCGQTLTGMQLNGFKWHSFSYIMSLTKTSPGLHALSLSHTSGFTMDSFIKSCTYDFSLHSLDLSWCGWVKNDTLSVFRSFRSLRNLKLMGCCKLTADGISSFIVAVQGLESLDISYNLQISDAEFAKIVWTAKELKWLRMVRTLVGEQTLRAVAERNGKRLEILDMSDCRNIHRKLVEQWLGKFAMTVIISTIQPVRNKI
ncbi:hypothetical protein BC937DRAFT_91770 [Endogone sp. FLAS-F59071]|nr:hypothetical protein BC937DRAFT_91770 [Endogone sp. FLAS-F59071]|eukprot:RUS15947.1 hypothetical protein BC937DRAFT_91770 [Endogone sp. FLAS-F59071]